MAVLHPKKKPVIRVFCTLCTASTSQMLNRRVCFFVVFQGHPAPGHLPETGLTPNKKQPQALISTCCPHIVLGGFFRWKISKRPRSFNKNHGAKKRGVEQDWRNDQQESIKPIGLVVQKPPPVVFFGLCGTYQGDGYHVHAAADGCGHLQLRWSCRSFEMHQIGDVTSHGPSTGRGRMLAYHEID